MTITLITSEEYNELVTVQQKCKMLTFNNNGYEYINRKDFTESDKKDYERVTEILKKSIKGFYEFNNFRLSNNGTIGIRFQYNWTADEERGLPYTGVGYLDLIELLEGFKETSQS